MKIIEMADWPRRQHFDIYAGKDFPYVGFCANVDVSAAVPFVKSHKYSIFSFILYAISRAANEIPEFRQRIRGDQIIEHEVIHPGFIVMTEQEPLFSFAEVKHQLEFELFHQAVKKEKARVKPQVTLEFDATRDDCMFTSCLPWLRFTSFTHPVNMKEPDTIPRISWGKIESKDGIIDMPVSVQVHHGMMDGWHIAQFYQKLERYLKNPTYLF
ncbi:chloramphenicol acetyltransferase [Algicola sagamiensis]|uniref:chloramphenicol acetyltransferase n=1 Tax=Algicola sagamiensis TaxID=163869 RepID=UPI0003A0F570|nr:chloramphenicol acetyltransferase [Algicola sagamiensis]